MQLKANLRDEAAINDGAWVTVFDQSPNADDNSMEIKARGYTAGWKRRIGEANTRFSKAYQRSDRAPAAIQHATVVDCLFEECVLEVKGLKDGAREMTLAEAHAICRELRGAPLFALFTDAVGMVDARREIDAEELGGNSQPALNGS